MSTIQAKNSEIAKLVLPETATELIFPDASKLDDLQIASTADWKKVFSALKKAVKVQVGQTIYIVQNIPLDGKEEGGDPYLTPEPTTERSDPKIVEAIFYHNCAASGKAHFHTDAWEFKEAVDPAMILPMVRFLIANRIETHKSRRGVDQKDGYKWIGKDPISYQLDKALAFFNARNA